MNFFDTPTEQDIFCLDASSIEAANYGPSIST